MDVTEVFRQIPREKNIRIAKLIFYLLGFVYFIYRCACPNSSIPPPSCPHAGSLASESEAVGESCYGAMFHWQRRCLTPFFFSLDTTLGHLLLRRLLPCSMFKGLGGQAGCTDQEGGSHIPCQHEVGKRGQPCLSSKTDSWHEM